MTLPKGEWDRRKEKLHRYLGENPDAGWKELMEDPEMVYALKKFYGCRRPLYGSSLNDAKKDAGVYRSAPRKRKKQPIPEWEWEDRRERLHNYLAEHPGATRADIKKKKVHYSALKKFYKRRINDAKRAAGVDEKHIRRNRVPEGEWEKRREKLHRYLAENPDAGIKEIKEDPERFCALYKLYRASLKDAKRAAGVDEKHIRGKGFSIPEEKWNRRKEELHRYIRENPDVTLKELNQTTHERALRKFYSGRINELKGHLGIKRNKIKRKELQEEFEKSIEHPVSEDDAVLEAGFTAIEESRMLLERIKNTLTEKELVVINMRYVHRMTFDDVGKAIGNCREAVRQTEKRALKKIRERYANSDISVSDFDTGVLKEQLIEISA